MIANKRYKYVKFNGPRRKYNANSLVFRRRGIGAQWQHYRGRSNNVIGPIKNFLRKATNRDPYGRPYPMPGKWLKAWKSAGGQVYSVRR